MDKMLYKILFSLEPSNRNTARPAPPREKEKEREIGRSKKGIGPEVCPPPVQSALARPSPREVPVAAVVSSSSTVLRPSHGTVLIYMAYQMGIHPFELESRWISR